MKQGDVFWAGLVPQGSAPGYDRPYLIVQNDVFNSSRINTVVVCSLTANLRRARDPGNVLLLPGEAGLPEQSIVNVTQIAAVDKTQLREKIGTLSKERVQQVVAGINLLLEPREAGGGRRY